MLLICFTDCGRLFYKATDPSLPQRKRPHKKDGRSQHIFNSCSSAQRTNDCRATVPHGNFATLGRNISIITETDRADPRLCRVRTRIPSRDAVTAALTANRDVVSCVARTKKRTPQSYRASTRTNDKTCKSRHSRLLGAFASITALHNLVAC